MKPVLLGVGVALAALVVAVPLILLKAFVAMLLLGAVHADVFEWVPALGLWQTFLVTWLLSVLIPTSTNTSTNSSS